MGARTNAEAGSRLLRGGAPLKASRPARSHSCLAGHPYVGILEVTVLRSRERRCGSKEYEKDQWMWRSPKIQATLVGLQNDPRLA